MWFFTFIHKLSQNGRPPRSEAPSSARRRLDIRVPYVMNSAELVFCHYRGAVSTSWYGSENHGQRYPRTLSRIHRKAHSCTNAYICVNVKHWEVSFAKSSYLSHRSPIRTNAKMTSTMRCFCTEHFRRVVTGDWFLGQKPRHWRTRTQVLRGIASVQYKPYIIRNHVSANTALFFQQARVINRENTVYSLERHGVRT